VGLFEFLPCRDDGFHACEQWFQCNGSRETSIPLTAANYLIPNV
jgi:hypothetical protein